MAKLQRIQNTAARTVLHTQHPHSSCSLICTGCLFTFASLTKQSLTYKVLACNLHARTL